jgi:hypothetical protein
MNLKMKVVFKFGLATLPCFFAFSACSGDNTPTNDGGTDASIEAPPPPPLVTITATVGSTTFVTREHFLASGEMQISGEPFAEAMGRVLADYSRDNPVTDLYADTAANSQGTWIDLPGFSTAVESYEYSKQAMNTTAFESGAGTSLVYGPLVNASALHGAAATTNLSTFVQHFAQGSNALGLFVFPAGTFPQQPSLAFAPRGPGDANAIGVGTGAENPLGWPGIWPTVHLFDSFDPTIAPTSAGDLYCAISSDDDPAGCTGLTNCGALASADYECDATTLHLPNRATQIHPFITPGADGFSAWKYGLWVLNYLQIMHDSTEAAVSTVASADLANVGSPGNQIVGADDTGTPTAAGTFLGSSNIEGFQAQMFILEIDNRGEDWLEHLATTDGATLGGFGSTLAAEKYDYLAPLEWFPAIAVAESDDGSGFPMPAYTVSSPDSHLLDLIGMTLGYSEFAAISDPSNADVGGAQPALSIFDGDPFPADNGKADGENTLHDRSLAMLRVALIDMDRIHADPASGVLVDDVTMAGNVPTRQPTVSTTSLAYSILAMRTALRSLSSQLELYSNNTPDSAIVSTPLDALPINHPSGDTFSQHVATMLKTQGDLLYNSLTTSDGHAYDGWDVGKSAPIDQSDTLDAHTAAIRGLFAMYLATGDVKYRDRAMAVYTRMDQIFYDVDARIYSSSPAPMTDIVFTPVRFALLQSSLRDVYELVAARPGGEALEPVLEERVARLNKLILNGWDDRNYNRLVDWPAECVNVQGTDAQGQPLPRGGLQMAERTLTGETGAKQEQIAIGGQRDATSDREHDCVPEIDDAKLPSSLADSVTFHVARPQ